jgi:hypothetical protein
VKRTAGVCAALALAAGIACAQTRSEELERAHAEVIAAQKALEEARRKREAGVEALPGERLGIKGGGSRFGDAYFERQKRLEDEVRAAEERLARAYQRWNELK